MKEDFQRLVKFDKLKVDKLIEDFSHQLSCFGRVTDVTAKALANKLVRQLFDNSHGQILTIEEFIDIIENQILTPSDGICFYWNDEDMLPTELQASFNICELKENSNIYKYVIWYSNGVCDL